MEKHVFNFTIEGETPAKKNSRIVLRNGKNVPSKRYQEWHESAMEQIKLLANVPKEPIFNPVLVHLVFCHGDMRRRDSDNGCSSIMDLLVDAGILEDDKWQIVQNIGITNKYKKNDAYCEITIQEI